MELSHRSEQKLEDDGTREVMFHVVLVETKTHDRLRLWQWLFAGAYRLFMPKDDHFVDSGTRYVKALRAVRRRCPIETPQFHAMSAAVGVMFDSPGMSIMKRIEARIIAGYNAENHVRVCLGLDELPPFNAQKAMAPAFRSMPDLTTNRPRKLYSPMDQID